MQTYRVQFMPDDVGVEVEIGTTILDAAHQAKVALRSPCGGKGMCKKCLVRLDGDEELLQACQYHINSDLVVHVPAESYHWGQQILQTSVDLQKTTVNDPAVKKCFLRLAEPSLKDLRSDQMRVMDALRERGFSLPRLSLSVIQELPKLLRRSDYEVTAVMSDNTVLCVEGGDTTGTCYGLAIDVGTTTVVATLLDLTTGNPAAVSAIGNPQTSAGEDVISRVQYAGSEQDGLQKLQRMIIQGLNDLIEQVCRKGGGQRRDIYEIVAAGNATMQHLLLGAPVEQIALAPYVSAFSSPVLTAAGDLHLAVNEQARIFIMPSVAGHVGGDTVAVTLAMMMDQSSRITLALDIGTNGELVLGSRNKLLTCSTAAGPALEGARILHGMRAAEGAIEKVVLGDTVELSVIGEARPIGICGSGLVDAVAELYRTGLLDETGRLLSGEEISARTPSDLKERIFMHEDAPAFVLVSERESGLNGPVLLTQRDIRETQLAIAAIRSGIRILMGELGVGYDDIAYVYLAGAFSNYVSPGSAARLGLIPPELADRIRPVGNAVSTGVKRVLLNRQARQYAETLARKMSYVELAGRADFQELFGESLIFPAMAEG